MAIHFTLKKFPISGKHIKVINNSGNIYCIVFMLVMHLDWVCNCWILFILDLPCRPDSFARQVLFEMNAGCLGAALFSLLPS